MKWVLLIAFLIRILTIFNFHHSDMDQFYFWSKDIYKNGILNFYDRNIDNAVRPTYPPVSSLVFWLDANLYFFLLSILWFLNTHISFFPSNIYVWFEFPHGLYLINKVPGIFADLGICFVLYLITKRISPKSSRKLQLLPSVLFAVLPPFWYITSVWGQIDSLYILPLLLSVYFLFKEKPIISFFLFGIAFLTKPISLFAFPIFLLVFLRKFKLKVFIIGFLIFLLQSYLLYFPFHSQGTLEWIFKFNLVSFKGELTYLVSNAFNFWGLVLGFKNISETTLIFGIPANILGILFFILSTLLVLKKLFRKPKINLSQALILSSITCFLAFFFLPKMHERYFYPSIIFLLPLILNKKILIIFLGFSLTFMLNLYNGWFYPKMDFLIALLTNETYQKGLVITNLVFFIYLLKQYLSDHEIFV